MSEQSGQSAVVFRVRYGETDQMGVAYHAHYLVWCEMARTEHMRRVGVRYRDLEARGFKLAVAEASLRYSRPARYDDEVRAVAWLADVASRAVTFGYRIERVEDAALLCTASTTLVCLDTTNKPTRIPDDAVTLMKSMVQRA